MQVLAINCPFCGDKLEQLPNRNLFEEEEHGFIYGCETLGCEGAIFRFYMVEPKEEELYVLKHYDELMEELGV